MTSLITIFSLQYSLYMRFKRMYRIFLTWKASTCALSACICSITTCKTPQCGSLAFKHLDHKHEQLMTSEDELLCMTSSFSLQYCLYMRLKRMQSLYMRFKRMYMQYNQSITPQWGALAYKHLHEQLMTSEDELLCMTSSFSLQYCLYMRLKRMQSLYMRFKRMYMQYNQSITPQWGALAYKHLHEQLMTSEDELLSMTSSFSLQYCLYMRLKRMQSLYMRFKRMYRQHFHIQKW